MMDCRTAKRLISEVLANTIDAAQLEQLKEHAETCDACRQELAGCHLIEAVLKDSFSPQTAAGQARDRILEGLSARPDSTERSPRVLQLSWPSAIAATILLVAGGLIGLAVGTFHSWKPSETRSLVRVPMHMSDVEGTVLVKHQDADTWHAVTDGGAVYLGDTFHCMAQSAFVLVLADDISTIDVGQNSMLALTSYDHETQFSLEHGECTARLESPHGPFFVRTPHGRVEALGTEFTVTVE